MDKPLIGTPAHEEIREGVRRLCARFPGEYWRKLDAARGYPTEFVNALTEAGYLAALIPEEFGGAGLSLSAAAAILETVQAEGCNGAACHAQMYIMGTILRHGSPAQKAQYLPKIASGALRLQAFGVTEPTSGTDTTSLRTFARREGDHYVVNGQKVWTSRSEHSDLMLLLARTTPRDQVARKTEGLSTFIVDMRAALGHGLTIRPIRTMMNHNSCEVFFDNMVVPAENLVGEEGRGFRYVLDGMNAERLLIAAECIGDAKWFTAKSVARSDRIRVYSFRSPRPTRRCARPNCSCRRAARSSTLACPVARRRTWRRCSPRRRRGRPLRPACRRMAGTVLPRNTTSSANSARRGCIRWRRSVRT